MKALKLLVLVLISISTGATYAQNAISGRVTDTREKPISYANVVLLQERDSLYINGVVTDNEGRFRLESDKAGFLRISCIGYDDVFVHQANGEIGNIQMSESDNLLGEVTVKANLPKTELKRDALVTTIQGSALSRAGTANDVLARVPGVISSNGGIEVFGKGTPLIYINGRQMRNTSELDQLSSSQVKNVEVVTNPGARYDATVNAVIRITTIKPIGEGWSFDNRAVAGIRHYFYGLDEFNFNYRKGGFDIFGMLEYSNIKDRVTNITSQETFLSPRLLQDGIARRYNKNQTFAGKIGFNYVFNEHHSMGAIYQPAYRPTKQDNESFATMTIDGVLDNETSNNSHADINNVNHLLSGYYNGSFGKWTMDINVDALWNRANTDQLLKETSTQADDRIVTTESDAKSRMIAGKAVATRQFGKGNVSFGGEFSHTHRTDNYSNLEHIINDSKTRIEESNGALFVEVMQNIGKVMLSAGLRYEHIDSRYYDHDVKMQEQSRIYDNLFPSAMLMFPIKNTRVRLSYNRKVERPAYSQLSSNVEYINRYTYQSGNPFLRPFYRDNISLAIGYKWLNMMLEYSHTSDYIITAYTQYGDDPSIALLQKKNAKSLNQLQAMVSISPSFGIWHPTLMTAMMAQQFNLTFCGKKKNMNHPLGIIRFNNAIQLPADTWINADFAYRTNGNTENLYMKGMWKFDLSIYKAFAHDKWSLKLSCEDVFNTSRSKAWLYSDVRRIFMHKINDTRAIELTFRYNFNAAKSKYKGTGAANEERNRIQ